MTTACRHCSERIGEADVFCHACGGSLASAAPHATRALVPSDVRSAAELMALLPAVRADLAPFLPALRNTATVLATAALADLAARYAAPALARKTLELVKGGPRRGRITRTTMVEKTVTVRQWTSVRS